MDATEPTYVATTIFQDRKSYEQWSSSRSDNNMTLQRKPETVYYEGTLVISSGTLCSCVVITVLVWFCVV